MLLTAVKGRVGSAGELCTSIGRVRLVSVLQLVQQVELLPLLVRSTHRSGCLPKRREHIETAATSASAVTSAEVSTTIAASIGVNKSSVVRVMRRRLHLVLLLLIGGRIATWLLRQCRGLGCATLLLLMVIEIRLARVDCRAPSCMGTASSRRVQLLLLLLLLLGHARNAEECFCGSELVRLLLLPLLRMLVLLLILLRLILRPLLRVAALRSLQRQLLWPRRSSRVPAGLLLRICVRRRLPHSGRGRRLVMVMDVASASHTTNSN